MKAEHRGASARSTESLICQIARALGDMFGWLDRRRGKRQLDGEDPAEVINDLRRKLQEAELAEKAEADADSLCRAFAKVLEEHDEWILDARLLPCPKDVIHAALNRRIRFLEGICRDGPDRRWKERIDVLKALRLRVAGFQTIDAEDEQAVVEANRGQLDDRARLVLFSKYHERSMTELGLQGHDRHEVS